MNYTGEQDRLDALDDYLKTVKDKTGRDLGPELDYGGAMGGGAMPAHALLQQANDKVNAIKKDYPELDLDPMSHDELDKNGIEKRHQADADYEAEMARPRGTAATLGVIVGGLAAGVADPINLLALPVAPETSAGILANALRWGAIGAGAATVGEAIQAPYQEQVHPGRLMSGAPLLNIAEAGLGTAALSALFPALAKTWEAVRGEFPWPTHIKIAGDIVSGQANTIQSNVYPGVEGNVAHEQAMATAISQILRRQPVDVSKHITPELEAQSRNLMVRLMGERAVALPIFDERTVRLMSEEAVLRQQHAALGTEIAGLPEGDLSAADRLNRLQAVEAQLPTATGDVRKALERRRDQILVDTTPEALQAAAEPIIRRQAIGAQQARIANRLDAIQAERRQIEVQNLSMLPRAALGQTMPVRAVPIEAIRTQAQAAATTATELRTAAPNLVPELPFERTAAEAQAEAARAPIEADVQQRARNAGYDMPAEEASRITDKLLDATPEDAQTLLRNLQISPRQVADAPTHIKASAEEIPIPVEPVKDIHAPDYQAALRADLDRELLAFHGSTVKFDEPNVAFGGTRGGSPHDKGVIYFSPSKKLAENFGGHVYERNINMSNAGIYDVAELIKDPAFQADMKRSHFETATRNEYLAKQAETPEGKERIEKNWQDTLFKRTDPEEIGKRNDVGLVRADPSITGAIINRARAAGQSVAVIQNMAEGRGKAADQILVLDQNAIRPSRPGPKPLPEPSPQFPVGVDAQGRIVYRNLQDALTELDHYKTAAEQIAACAAEATAETV